MNFPFFVDSGCHSELIFDLAQQYGLNLQLSEINQNFQDVALLLDQHQQLWLTADQLRMRSDWLSQLYRLKRATPKTELLLQATQAKSNVHIFDATAGLGHDSLLLASSGAQVSLCERHPVMLLMLAYELSQMQQGPLAHIVSNMTLISGDARDLIKETNAEVVYLDPMFPVTQTDNKKGALVKKEMQVLHRLYGNTIDDSAALMPVTKNIKRVIVKRPKLAPYLSSEKPHHQWIGKACRFDGYFSANRIN